MTTYPSLVELGIFADPVMLAYEAGYELDDWQKEYVRSEDQFTLLNVTRQGGKSFVVALRVLWEALTQPKMRGLFVCPAQRQSSEIFDKALEIYRATGRLIPSVSENMESLRLVNGNRLAAVPGTEKTIRGISRVTHMVYDEGAWIEDELYAATMPMIAVAKNARVTVPSTPFGKRGWYYEEWSKGKNWRRFEVPWQKCPRISPEFIQSQREKFGDDYVAQEFECKFLDSARSAFRHEDIVAAFDPREAAWAL